MKIYFTNPSVLKALPQCGLVQKEELGSSIRRLYFKRS